VWLPETSITQLDVQKFRNHHTACCKKDDC